MSKLKARARGGACRFGLRVVQAANGITVCFHQHLPHSRAARLPCLDHHDEFMTQPACKFLSISATSATAFSRFQFQTHFESPISVCNHPLDCRTSDDRPQSARLRDAAAMQRDHTLRSIEHAHNAAAPPPSWLTANGPGRSTFGGNRHSRTTNSLRPSWASAKSTECLEAKSSRPSVLARQQKRVLYEKKETLVLHLAVAEACPWREWYPFAARDWHSGDFLEHFVPSLASPSLFRRSDLPRYCRSKAI